MNSYLMPIDTCSLSRTVFEVFDIKVMKVWPWPLTFEGHLRSKLFSTFKSLYRNSYLTSVYTFSLSCTVFEIFDFKNSRVWPWPLTFRGHPESKIFSLFESQYHGNMWLPIKLLLTLSLYVRPFSRYSTSKFLGFDLDLWPLEVTWGWKYFHHSKAHIMTSYLTSIDTFSLFRTVFEIFDIKVFRDWPWPLTFRGHPRSKIFSLFENPYMTSYSTSIDTFSLFRTVFEIFDIKVCRVRPWPLTFRGHLRSKKISLFESPYMISYLTTVHTFSLSRTVFEIFDFVLWRIIC